MSIYKKATGTLLLLLLTAITSAAPQHHPQGFQQLDLMVDFGYPVSTMQSVRQDVSQALYFLQQHDHNSVSSILEDALTKLNSRNNVDPQDIEYIQAMIDKINALIESLEESDRSAIDDLCQQLQSKL